MKRHILLLICFISSLNSFGQSDKFTIGDIYTLESKILEEERQIAIYLPSESAQTEERYPVLYLLDAEWNFHFVSAVIEKLSSSGDMPRMMLVGIINKNRNKDLTPPGLNDNPARFGGGKRFLNFLTEELQPWVRNNFNPQPYSILAGHSFGGLFTIFSMIEIPEAFQAYIALSPSLGRNDEQQVKHAEQYFKGLENLSKSLYVALANEGGGTYVSSNKLNEVIKLNLPHEFNYKFERLPGENHTSISSIGFIRGLKFIFEGFNPEKGAQLDEIFLIENHFQQLSDKFGYTIKVPEHYYQEFAKEQIGERELDYALYIMGKYEKAYPNSPQLLIHYADIYLLKGDFDNARKFYTKLRDLGIQDESLERILNRIENK